MPIRCAIATTFCGPTSTDELGVDRVHRVRGRVEQVHRACRLVGVVVHVPRFAIREAAPGRRSPAPAGRSEKEYGETPLTERCREHERLERRCQPADGTGLQG